MRYINLRFTLLYFTYGHTMVSDGHIHDGHKPMLWPLLSVLWPSIVMVHGRHCIGSTIVFAQVECCLSVLNGVIYSWKTLCAIV